MSSSNNPSSSGQPHRKSIHHSEKKRASANHGNSNLSNSAMDANLGLGQGGDPAYHHGHGGSNTGAAGGPSQNFMRQHSREQLEAKTYIETHMIDSLFTGMLNQALLLGRQLLIDPKPLFIRYLAERCNEETLQRYGIYCSGSSGSGLFRTKQDDRAIELLRATSLVLGAYFERVIVPAIRMNGVVLNPRYFGTQQHTQQQQNQNQFQNNSMNNVGGQSQSMSMSNMNMSMSQSMSQQNNIFGGGVHGYQASLTGLVLPQSHNHIQQPGMSGMGMSGMSMGQQSQSQSSKFQDLNYLQNNMSTVLQGTPTGPGSGHHHLNNNMSMNHQSSHHHHHHHHSPSGQGGRNVSGSPGTLYNGNPQNSAMTGFYQDKRTIENNASLEEIYERACLEAKEIGIIDSNTLNVLSQGQTGNSSNVVQSTVTTAVAATLVTSEPSGTTAAQQNTGADNKDEGGTAANETAVSQPDKDQQTIATSGSELNQQSSGNSEGQATTATGAVAAEGTTVTGDQAQTQQNQQNINSNSTSGDNDHNSNTNTNIQNSMNPQSGPMPPSFVM